MKRKSFKLWLEEKEKKATPDQLKRLSKSGESKRSGEQTDSEELRAGKEIKSAAPGVY